DYIVLEDSESPDGHYGLLIPKFPESELADDDYETMANYVVDLKAHRVLGKLSDAHYFERRNHSGLSAIWDSESTHCVVVFDARFGFASLSVVEVGDASFKEI